MRRRYFRTFATSIFRLSSTSCPRISPCFFQKLPGAELTAVTERICATCAKEAAMAFSVEGLRFRGRGVALSIAVPRLMLLRRELANGWRSWMSAQDGQPFRPHVTIQNKADPAAARALHARLDAETPTIRGTIVVGALNLGGSIEMIPNAVRIAALAIDKQAQTLLMPVSTRRRLNGQTIFGQKSASNSTRIARTRLLKRWWNSNRLARLRPSSALEPLEGAAPIKMWNFDNSLYRKRSRRSFHL
jgi:hypothetical protein